jgi:hypothetical protein
MKQFGMLDAGAQHGNQSTRTQKQFEGSFAAIFEERNQSQDAHNLRDIRSDMGEIWGGNAIFTHSKTNLYHLFTFLETSIGKAR